MKKMILVLLLCANVLLLADDTPYNFIRFNSTARAAALGNAVVSIEEDASLIFFNPALLQTADEKTLTTTFSKHVLDINSGNIVYKINQFDLDGASLAAQINFNSYGTFDYIDDVGKLYGNGFSGSDLSFGVTYSNELDSNWFYGVTGKFIYLSLETQSSSAFAVDAGMFYRVNERTKLGFSLLHLGTEMSSLNGQSATLPADARIGINHRLKGLPLLINFSFHHLADEVDGFFERFKNFSIGGELYLSKVINLRAGYDNQIRNYASADDNKGLSGLSGGIGIKFEEVNFDYGYAEYGASVGLHRFSLALEL
ncbi:MAG: PorV/PorQ family protein [Candidatus Kapaibacterium sp.]|nr:PorV/PorQ family protein [Ignavibacteriota bacterium]MCB9220194.1 PorV/PorQ family protein [Ignavibacteria bacterium]